MVADYFRKDIILIAISRTLQNPGAEPYLLAILSVLGLPILVHQSSFRKVKIYMTKHKHNHNYCLFIEKRLKDPRAYVTFDSD